MSDQNHTPKNDTKPALLPQHVEYLNARKIPIEFAIEAGVVSFDEPTTLRAAAFKRVFKGLSIYRSSGLLTPYKVQPLDGINRARIRWDLTKQYAGVEGTSDERSIDIPRYTAQEGVPVIPYYPPGVCIEGVIDNTAVPLFIVEAPMKALSLTANGFKAIGMGGVEVGAHDVQQWKTFKHLCINKELDRVLWKGRAAYITYDAGITNNPRVALGAAKLATVLHDRGADVRLVILPLLHIEQHTIDDLILYDTDDQGPDDFLAKNGTEALQQLIDDAIPADPIARVKAVMQAADLDKDMKRDTVAALLADLTFVAALHVGGHMVVDQVTALIKSTGFKARALHDQIRKLVLRLDKNATNADDATKLPYVIDNGRIAMTTLVGGVPTTKYLADFTASITEEVTADDGIDKTRIFTIEGKLPDGKVLHSIDVPAIEFAKLEWTSAWGSKAILRAGKDTRDHTRVAIQALSKPTEATEYTHVGWREIDGKHVYLHPGGAIGTDAPVRVRINVERGRFGLPSCTENIKDAVKLSLSILDAGPLDITLPVLASAYTAVLAELLEIDFAVWIVGPSGSYKSTLAAKAMAHFGAFDYHSLPMTWNATAGAIEMMLFRMKDALAVIDNYVPGQTPRDHQQLSGTALRVIQAIGDRAGRGRLDRNADERAVRRPRGLAVMTGEDLPPTNESTIGRLVVIDVKKGGLRLEQLATIQDKAEMLSHAMRGFLEWLAPKLETDTDKIKQLRKSTAASYRAQLTGSRAHERAPNSLAALAVGFHLLLDFAVEVGALDADLYDHLHAKADAALLRIARRQVANVEGMKPYERYLSSLRALLLQGRAVLAKKHETLELAAISSPTSRGIGWLDGDYVYLVPELAWEVVEAFNAREGWPYKKTQMHKQLADLGIIERQDRNDAAESRLTRRRSLGGASPRVFAIHRRHFEDSLPGAVHGQHQGEAFEAKLEVEMHGNGLAVEEYDMN